MIVRVNGKDLSGAIRVLRNKLNKDGLLQELVQRRFALSPSERRREKAKRAEARNRKQAKFREWRRKARGTA